MLTESVFAFLQENLLRGCHHRTQQTSRRHTMKYTRACYLRLNHISHVTTAWTVCHVGKRVASLLSLYPPSPSVDWIWLSCFVAAFTARLEDVVAMGRKMWIPLTSRTLDARRGAPPNNWLVRYDTPLVCAPSQQLHHITTREERSTQHESLRVHRRLINKEVSDLRKVPTRDGDSKSAPLTAEELVIALKHLESGKSPGLDSVSQGFILHDASAVKSWLCDFFICCMRQL